MAQSDDLITVRVEFLAPDVDPELAERMTARLRRELLKLDVEAVERPSAGPAPSGSRAAEVAELSTLLVSMTTTPALLGALVATIRAWLGYQAKREVELERDGVRVRVTGRPTKDDRDLVRQLLRGEGS